jgi:D-arabinose 1-dehydrogenase-like Zn-dependent alcohol dehydrogenase
MNTPSAMQALQMRGLGDLVLTDLPVPTPGPRDVLMHTLAATICTSDLHDLSGNPFGIVPPCDGHDRALKVALTFPEIA